MLRRLFTNGRRAKHWLGSGAAGRAVLSPLMATLRPRFPWLTLSALTRFVWEPLAWLDVELEAGVIAPLYRESFFFAPSVSVYEAPALAFLSRAGLGLRFP